MDLVHDEFLRAEHDAAQAAPLAVDVFGGRIDHAVGAERERALEQRRGEHVVDHQRGAGRVRDLRHFGDVDDFERGIGRAFEKERLGVRPHGVFPGLEIAAVDQGRGDAEARQVILDDVAAGAEHGFRRHHVIAGLELADQRDGDRGHAGRGGARRFRAFERRHAALEHVDGRIGEARILIAGIFALEARLGLRRGVVDIALSQKHRLGGFAERRAQRAGLNQACFGAIGLFRGRGHVASIGQRSIGQTKQNPAGRKILRPGSHIPGLLAICFTWLASRPAQMTTG